MNMHTMLRAENATSQREREFAAWLKKLPTILCREISEQEENGLAWDLFADGATPAEAAYELRHDISKAVQS